MNVLILSSASVNIDQYYMSIARSISKYLADSNFDLVFGGSSSSMMGICYDEFIIKDRSVFSFTTEKYVADIKNLSGAKHFIKETTFDMKKAMFENSDLVVVLPGGIGTLSELLSYIEENRSNDKSVPIEIYDEDGYYSNLFEMFTIMQEKGFVSGEVMDLVNISHNKEEFIEHIDSYVYGKRGK